MTITCMNCGGLTSHMNGCKGDPETVTISRDTYELYKEAAEEWAESCKYLGLSWGTSRHQVWRCRCCRKEIPTHIDHRTPTQFKSLVHTHNCKAARILGLDREGS